MTSRPVSIEPDLFILKLFSSCLAVNKTSVRYCFVDAPVKEISSRCRDVGCG